MKKTTTTLSGLGVDVYNDNFEKAFRQFRKKVQKSGLIQEVRDRQNYQKPNETKRLARKAARRAAQLENKKNSKRLY
jgi:small subunit ribosomal protein S21